MHLLYIKLARSHCHRRFARVHAILQRLKATVLPKDSALWHLRMDRRCQLLTKVGLQSFIEETYGSRDGRHSWIKV